MDSGGPAGCWTAALGLIVHWFCTSRIGPGRQQLAEAAAGCNVKVAGDATEAVINAEFPVGTGAPVLEDGQSVADSDASDASDFGGTILPASTAAAGSDACEQPQNPGETCTLPPEYEALLEQRLAAYAATSPLKEMALLLELSADSTMEPLSHRSSLSGLPAWRLPGEDPSATATQTSTTFGHTLGGISPALLSNFDPLDNTHLNDGMISPVQPGDAVFNCPSSMVLSSEESPLTPIELALLRDQVLEVAAEEGAKVSARGSVLQPPATQPALPLEVHAGLVGMPAEQPAMSQSLTLSPRDQPHDFTGQHQTLLTKDDLFRTAPSLKEQPRDLTGQHPCLLTRDDVFRTTLPMDPMVATAGAAPPPPLQLPVHSSCPDQPRRAPPSSAAFMRPMRIGRLQKPSVAMGSMNGTFNSIPVDGVPGSASWTARSRDSNHGGSFSSRDATQLHGTGLRKHGNGFIGQGPFWTCGSSSSCNAGRCSGTATTCTADGRSGSGDNCSQAQKDGVTQAGTGTALIASKDGQVDVAGRISATIAECMELAAKAINVSPDSAPPEEELTTVLLETKEQKLHWRDFLTETVSTYKANNLFKNYDVEADPPRYSRPPLSRPQSGGGKGSTQAALPAGAKGPPPLNVGHMPRRKDPTPPQVVAPRGAGWSPILGGTRRQSPAPSTSNSRFVPCSLWLRGCMRPGQTPTSSTPVRCSESCIEDFEPANPRMWTIGGRRRQVVEEGEFRHVDPQDNPQTDEVASVEMADGAEGCAWHSDLNEASSRSRMSQRPARAG